MKEYVLNYYPIFKCLASECKHTCCAGWKINIDKQSLNAYKTKNSDLYKWLKKGINFKKSSFKVDKKGHCAFLNQKGLCEIIIHLGEQSLCQVCKDHPRFRSFFCDRIETGLGFCCEQATKIILSFKDKIQPVLVSQDINIKQLDFNQKNVLEFRDKALKILQNRQIDINQRINELLSFCNARLELEDFSKISKKFISFEHLDKSWTARLKSLKKQFIKDTAPSLTLYAEQFLVNSLYRHLSDAEDTMWVRARTISCVFGWFLINSIFEQERTIVEDGFNLILDIVRAYSAEIEYSQKNLDKLYLFAYKFIQI